MFNKKGYRVDIN